HFANAAIPEDKSIVEAYASGANSGLDEEIKNGFNSVIPADANVNAVADAIVKVVDMPVGMRPFRTHIDPANDVSEVVSAVADHIRAEFLHRIGLKDLLTTRKK